MILHTDLNHFYAAIEELHHWEYCDKPLAVAGSTEERHGITIDETNMRELLQKANERFPNAKIETGEIFPTNVVPVLVGDVKESVPQPIKWGFPNFKGSGVVINARSETATEKRMSLRAVREHRCVVPTTGLFEWSQNKPKHKYIFNTNANKVLYLAGLYADYDGARRFLILIKAANARWSRFTIVCQ